MVLRRRSARITVAGVAAITVAFAGPAASAGGGVEHFELKGEANRPYSIVAGPDGNMWFTQSDGNAIGRISPDGTRKRYILNAPNSHPYGITVGPDGNLWFTERSANRIGVMNTRGRILAEYDLPTFDAQPWDIALGGDGALWFTEENVDQIGRITVDGTITEYPAGIGTFPTGIGADAKGNIWYTGELSNKIGRIKTKKPDPWSTLKLFDVPTEGALPYDINLGPDGNMWFTNLASHKLGRINAKGKIKEFPVPGESGIAVVTAGPDGNLWFTQNDIAAGRHDDTDRRARTDVRDASLPVRHRCGRGRQHLVLRGLRRRDRAHHAGLTAEAATARWRLMIRRRRTRP